MSSNTEAEASGLRAASAAVHMRIAALVGVLCVFILIGWLFALPTVTRFVPGRPAMVPMTAVTLLLAAAGVALVREQQIAVRLGLVQLLAGVGILAAHLAGWPAQTLGLLWSSTLTGIGVIASAVATWLLASRRLWEGQVVAFTNLLFTGLIGLGHLVPRTDLYQFLPASGVAIPTILAFMALSLAQLLAFREGGVAAALTRRNTAGRTGLRLMLMGCGVPLLLAMLIILGWRQGLFDPETAVMLMAWGAIALLGALLWGFAAAVDKAQQAAVKAQRQQDRTRQMVAAALTHDIRSPLQTAKLSVAVLERVVQDPKALAAVHRVQRGHRRVDRLLRSLLDSLALESQGELELRPSCFDLKLLVLEVIEDSEARLESRVQVAGENFSGWWDRDAIFRVVENLFLNAVKYGEPRSPILCRLEHARDVARLSITNRGRPIPRSEWEIIFHPFARGAAAREAEPIGWGVGLAYARAVILRHGGTVQVDNSDENGTTFSVQLPLHARDKASNPSGVNE